MQILTTPNEILRTPAKKIDKIDASILNLIKDMKQTLIDTQNPQGVGLAAPQVGVSLQLFLMRPLPDETISVFINPKIIKMSQAVQSPSKKKGVFEGCLSIPSHYAPVERSLSVKLDYQTLDENNNLVNKSGVFSSFKAHIIQHEVDHLNGVLFVDRVLAQNIKLYKVDGEEWDEVSI